jgi:hypothetical protein
MKLFMVTLVSMTLFSNVILAATEQRAVQDIKNLLPATVNISGRDCNGEIAVNYLTVSHTTQGVFLSICS